MKRAIKKCLNLLSAILVYPAVLAFRIQSMITDSDSAITSWSQLASLIPGKTGIYLRRAFFMACLSRCDEDASIGFGTVFSHASAEIGHTTYVGSFCSIGNVQIADDVLIASHVSIMNGTHQHGISRLDIPVREQSGHYEPIVIGRDSWIGERSLVAASIGAHCVVGAGTLVLKPIPDYAIVVGVPARIIGDRREVAASAQEIARSANSSQYAEPAPC